MEYSIHQLSKLAGISARTLRYYDETGLLTPSRTSDAGYRFYGPDEVELLLQILFYRERGLSLDKIKSILYDSSFDRLAALYEHLEDLEAQQARISKLICTVHATIAAMKGEKTMTDKEKFEAFKQNAIAENESKYGGEIRRKYGNDAVEASNQKLLQMTGEEYERFESLGEEILAGLETAVRDKQDPEGETGRRLTALHREWLGYTWKEYSMEAHKGLAEMYLADERFKNYYDKNMPGCAEFLVQAIRYWAGK